MTRDNPETMAMIDSTAWHETALPAAVETSPSVRVRREDLEAAVHGGVLTSAQAQALWLRLSNPGQAAARASGPGQRAMPEPLAVVPEGSSGHGALVTLLLALAAALAAWFLRGLLRP